MLDIENFSDVPLRDLEAMALHVMGRLGLEPADVGTLFFYGAGNLLHEGLQVGRNVHVWRADPDDLTRAAGTLAHELVHVWQAQHRLPWALPATRRIPDFYLDHADEFAALVVGAVFSRHDYNTLESVVRDAMAVPIYSVPKFIPFVPPKARGLARRIYRKAARLAAASMRELR